MDSEDALGLRGAIKKIEFILGKFVSLQSGVAFVTSGTTMGLFCLGVSVIV